MSIDVKGVKAKQKASRYGNHGIAVENEYEYIRPMKQEEEQDFISQKYNETLERLRAVNKKIEEKVEMPSDFDVFVKKLANKFESNH